MSPRCSATLVSSRDPFPSPGSLSLVPCPCFASRCHVVVSQVFLCVVARRVCSFNVVYCRGDRGRVCGSVIEDRGGASERAVERRVATEAYLLCHVLAPCALGEGNFAGLKMPDPMRRLVCPMRKDATRVWCLFIIRHDHHSASQNRPPILKHCTLIRSVLRRVRGSRLTGIVRLLRR